MISDYYILDADNKPIKASVLEWARWFETIGNRRVAYTQINSQVTVSTVFLGIDHRYGDAGPPLLFETMVFRDGEEDYCKRYASWDDAETGHKVLVAKLRTGVSLKPR